MVFDVEIIPQSGGHHHRYLAVARGTKFGRVVPRQFHKIPSLPHRWLDKNPQVK